MSHELAASRIERVNQRIESTWIHYSSSLILIVLLYLVLAFYRLDAQSFWTDEAHSVNDAFQLSNQSRLYRLSPFYFNALKWWSNVAGTTEFALRAFSALVGVATVCLMYEIARRMFNRQTALTAGLLLATSPYFIWYSQEARYIGLTLAGALVMTYAFQRAIDGGSWKWWLLYGMSGLLALSTFATVLFLILAHGLYLVLYSPNRPLLRRWMASQAVVLLVFVVWFGVRSGPSVVTAVAKPPTVTWDQPQTRSRETLPTADLMGAIPYTFYTFSVGFSLGPSLRELHVSRSLSSLVGYAPILVPVGFLFVAMCLLGFKGLGKDKNTAIFLLVWLFVPIAVTFLVATMTSFNVFNTRYVALSLPAYLLLLAVGIGALGRRTLQLAALGAVLLVNGVSLANYYHDPRYAREDARSSAQYLESVVKPNDTILLVGSRIALQHYYRAAPPLVLIDNDATKNPAVLAAKLLDLSESRNQIWLVELRPWQTDPKGTVRATLDRIASRESYKGFAGVGIYSYRPRQGESVRR